MTQLYDLHSIPFTLDGAGMLVFETIADLAAYDDAASQDGALAYVQSVRSVWQRREQADPLTADGITNVENPTNTATWYRSTEASPSWLNQANWYLDGVDGDDEGAGTALDPLLTHDEFMRRLGQNKLTQDLTVSFADAIGADYNLVHATVPGQHNGCRVLYKGPDLSALTPLYTETFASFSAISRAGTGQRTNFLSVLDGGTWATYVGKIVLVTVAADPAAVGSYAWVCERLVGDDTQVYTTPFTQAAPGNEDATVVNPADGDTYVVVDPLVITSSRFLVSTDENVFTDGSTSVQFQNLSLDLNRTATISNGSTSFFSSWVYGLKIDGPANVSAWGCDLLNEVIVVRGGAFAAEACFLDGTSDTMWLVANDISATVSVLDDSVIMGDATIEANGGRLNITNLGAFTVSSTVVNLNIGGSAYVLGYIYGEGIIDSFFDLRSGTRVIANATYLATTDGPNVAFGGAVNQNWAGLPFIANSLITDSQAAWLNEL